MRLLLQTLFNFDRAENGFKRTMGKISCGHYLLFNQEIIRLFFYLVKRKESQYAVLFYSIFLRTVSFSRDLNCLSADAQPGTIGRRLCYHKWTNKIHGSTMQPLKTLKPFELT